MMKRRSGFTLIEMIIVVLLVAFLGAMIVTFMGKKIAKSGIPLTMTSEAASAQTTMESIILDYVTQMNNNTRGPENVLPYIKTRAGNGTYGSGVTAGYIFFNSGTENSTASNSGLLKVSVSRGNSTLQTVLTQSRNDTSDGTINF